MGVFAKFHLFRQLLGVERATIDCETGDGWPGCGSTNAWRFATGSSRTLNLSTGQRKRLALVVAMLENRQMCIFDQWAGRPGRRVSRTGLSPPAARSESARQDGDRHQSRRRYFGYGDRLIKLDQGTIVHDADLDSNYRLQVASLT